MQHLWTKAAVSSEVHILRDEHRGRSMVLMVTKLLLLLHLDKYLLDLPRNIQQIQSTEMVAIWTNAKCFDPTYRPVPQASIFS
ncbi:hypothetical protein BDW74DRAFT_154188 [Aspergillus multicolor]|uniref:uncharacterized protein n=1 Tax=Aspergillus multicolor TaxID=41759 RepID=UPI003CCD5F29